MKAHSGRAAAVLVAASFGFASLASADIKLQKKAKEAGLPATNCQYCHVDKLPKKGASALNERGTWLVAEKGKKAAKEVDVAWLKDYVEPKK